MFNDEFQSIYNLHEYLITLAVKNAENKSLDDERLARLDKMFESNQERDPTNKSVNFQNCRKSALLSRMLLIHKLNTLNADKKLSLVQLLSMYI